MVSSPPAGPSPEELQLTGLLGLINPESLESVVAHALNHRAEVSPNIRRELDSVIRDFVKISGFKNSDRAPAAKLKEPVLHQLYHRHSERVFSAILRTWAESHAVLMEAVSAHLLSKGVGAAYPDFAQHRLRGYWSNNDWRSEQDAIIEARSEFDKDDVALMLCYVTGRMPTHPEDVWEEIEEPDNRPFLDQARIYLEQLSPDSPLWETTIPEFLDSAREVLNVKVIERQLGASRRVLSAAIDEFVNRYSSHLNWLGLTRDSWAPPYDLNSLEVSNVQALLKSLSSHIDEYDATPVDGTSMDESQRLAELRTRILQRILEGKSQLDKILATDSDPDRPTLGGSGQGQPSRSAKPKANNEVTLSKLNVSQGMLEFSPERVGYHIDLPGSVDSLTVIPVATDPLAVIEVTIESPDGESHAIECSDGTFEVVGLNAHQTILSIRVVAEDGEANQTYTLIAERIVLKDAILSNIHLSDGELKFDPLVNEYRSTVANSVDNLVVTLTPGEVHAAVRVTASDEVGNVVGVIPSGDGEFNIPSLPVGQTVVSIAHLAENDRISNAYAIAVIRIGSSDSTLKSLRFSAGKLDFNPGQAEYNVDLPTDIDDLYIIPEPAHEGATLTAIAQRPGSETTENLHR